MVRSRRSGMKLKGGNVNHPSFQASIQPTPISPDPSGQVVLAKSEQAIVLNRLESLVASDQALAVHLAGMVQSLLEGYKTKGLLHRSNRNVVSLEAAMPSAGKAIQTLALADLVPLEKSIEATKDNYPVFVYNLPRELDACEIGHVVKQACRQPVTISQVQRVSPGQAIIHFQTLADAQLCLASDGAAFARAEAVWFLGVKIYGQTMNFNSLDQHKSNSEDSRYSTQAMMSIELYPTGAPYGQHSWQSTSRQPLQLCSKASMPHVQLETMLTDEEAPTPTRDPIRLLHELLVEDTDEMAVNALQPELGCEDQKNNNGMNDTVSGSFTSTVHQKERTQW
jgi:hypothetical protein